MWGQPLELIDVLLSEPYIFSFYVNVSLLEDCISHELFSGRGITKLKPELVQISVT